MKPKFVYPGQYKKSCLINTCWVLKLEYNVIIYAYKFSFILSELYIKVHFFIHDWKHWQLPYSLCFYAADHDPDVSFMYLCIQKLTNAIGREVKWVHLPAFSRSLS